jgi:HD-GYP domain-containing protein (c-di-GMP phosphodiesterase class II)
MTTSYSNRQLHRSHELLTRLSAALHGARLYPMSHPAVDSLVTDMRVTLEQYFSEGVDVALTFSEGEAILGDQVLANESVHFDQLVRDLSGSGAGSVTFRRGLEQRELSRVVEVLSMSTDEIESCGGIASLVDAAELQHVEITSVTVYVPPHDEGSLRLEGSAAARFAYDSALEVLRDMESAMLLGDSANVASVRNVVQILTDNMLGNKPAMMELAGLKDYDEYTFYHSVNTAILSLGLGAAISDDRRFLSSLGAGALLHDLGKLAVDAVITRKEGSLSADEWAEMREHPVYGAEQAARLQGLDRSCIVIIYEHHQRLDGSGYPLPAPGKRQHLSSRIVAIADAYDAMTSKRSYSAARLPDEAMGVLVHGAGSAFDPSLVRLFVRAVGVYPARSVVRLSNGELAVVAEAAPDAPLLPVVNIFAAPDGTLLPEVLRVALDSMEGRGRSVAACLSADELGIDVEDYL